MDYGYNAKSTADGVFNFMCALGEVAFSYAGHNVVLEIQATMPSTPEQPSKKPMWKGVVLAYIGVAFCYFPVAFIGYYVYGNTVDDNILITLEHPAWLIAAANMFVIVHVIGGYQVSFNFWLVNFVHLSVNILMCCILEMENNRYFQCQCLICWKPSW